MSKAEEHDRRMRAIESDPAMMHDYNLITVLTDLAPEVASSRVFEIRRRDTSTLRMAR